MSVPPARCACRRRQYNIQYESLDWRLPPDISMSNTARRKDAGQYEAAMTSPIADLDVRLDQATANEAEEAGTEIVRFDAEFGARMVTFSSMLLRSESTASSRIAQLTATAKAIALAELGDTSNKNAAMIVANVKAMKAAISLADDISAESIIAMHTALLEDEHPEWVAHWRDAPKCGSAATSSVRTAQLSFHHIRTEYRQRSTTSSGSLCAPTSPLVQAALAHAQFETIHPFPDGNGRTGRASIHSMLRRRGVTRNVTVPISSGLLVDTNAYFAPLNAYRDGDPNEIVEQMADAAFLSITNARTLSRNSSGSRNRPRSARSTCSKPPRSSSSPRERSATALGSLPTSRSLSTGSPNAADVAFARLHDRVTLGTLLEGSDNRDRDTR